jgi:hypothetical protein
VRHVKNPCDFVEVESERQNSVGHFSPEIFSFANTGLRSRSSGSGLSHERAATLGGAAWVPLELTEETKHERRTKGLCNKGLSAYGSSRSQANLSLFMAKFASSCICVCVCVLLSVTCLQTICEVMNEMSSNMFRPCKVETCCYVKEYKRLVVMSVVFIISFIIKCDQKSLCT